MADYRISQVPSVSIARSKYNRTFRHNLSFNLGEITILGCDEVIPGSTHKLDFGSLIRMSTPIAPIMDDIQMDVYTFFCPLRLTWQNWKRFMGENTTGTGAINAVNSDKTIPMYTTTGSIINTIADDLGVPAYAQGNNSFQVSELPFRAVYLIYNRWFRKQSVEAPLGVSLTDVALTNSIYGFGMHDASGVVVGTPKRLIAYKLPDFFTEAEPYAQKGNPVSIFPTGATAPIIASGTSTHSFGADVKLAHLTSSTADATLITKASSGNPNVSDLFGHVESTSYSGTNYKITGSNLYADLGNAVNATINDLRFAFQVQKFLEKDALMGSRYWELLKAHYNVSAPDASLQDPQLLGHCKFDINISQVLQTTGFTDPTNTNLGTPGANSVTAGKGNIFVSSFVEHGYLITMAVARQKSHTYTQGLNRMWTRSSRFDFYFPVFANLPAQKVLNKEIDVQASSPNAVFGYQEAWAEYRYLPSYNSGLLNPSRSGALDYWVLADKYVSTPTLTPSFLKESRDNLSRALVTGSNGPDFIGSWYFRDTVVNPMPLYSIPGFADHH